MNYQDSYQRTLGSTYCNSRLSWKPTNMHSSAKYEAISQASCPLCSAVRAYQQWGRHAWTQKESRPVWQTGRLSGRAGSAGRDRVPSCLKAAEASTGFPLSVPVLSSGARSTQKLRLSTARLRRQFKDNRLTGLSCPTCGPGWTQRFVNSAEIITGLFSSHLWPRGLLIMRLRQQAGGMVKLHTAEHIKATWFTWNPPPLPSHQPV